MPVDDYLQEALRTYEEHRESLLAQGAGRYVLIRGEDLSVWDTYEDALTAGYDRYGVDGKFLVKKIQGPVDGIQFFTRDIQCPA